MMNLTAKFEEGEYFTVASSLYQYDKNRTLEVEGVDLPNGYTEVQFSKDEKQGESIQKMGTVSNGKLTVDVPNALTFDELRTSDYSIWAFIYVTDEQMGRTVYKILMNVIARPELTGEAPEPDVENPFNDALQEVKKEVEKSKGYSESAKEFSDSAKGFSEQASDSKDEAERIKNEVVDLANGFDAKVNESIETITQTGTEQVGAVEQAGKQQTQTVNDAGTKQVQAVTGEGVKQKQELQKETELFKGDREQIAKNKDDILKLAIKPEVSGNPVVLKDSADFPTVSLELSGSTTQVQTTGKNLADISKIVLLKGWSQNGEEFIANESQGIPLKIPYKGKIDEQITFSLLVNIKNEATCSLRVRDSLNKDIFTGEHFKDSGYKTITVTLPKNDDYTFQFAQGTVFSGIVKNIQLEKGSIATSYEPYTGGEPSPSPDYQQEVKQGEWDSINCTGKNLFNYLKAYEKCKIDNGVINDYGGSILNIKNKIPKMLTGKTVTISALLKTTSVINVRIRVTRKDGTYLNSNLIKNNGFYDLAKITFKVQENDIFQIAYSEGGSTGFIEVKEFQVEISDFYTQYEPYKGFTSPISPIELSKWDKIKLVDGVWKKENHTFNKILDGTEIWLINQHQSGRNSFAYYANVNSLNSRFNRENVTLSNIFVSMAGNWAKPDIFTIANNTNGFYIRMPDEIASVDMLKSWLQEHKPKVVTELLAPTYEALPQEVQDLLNKITTFYPNTVLQTNEGITFDLKYVADTKNYIDNKLNENINKLKTAIVSAGGM